MISTTQRKSAYRRHDTSALLPMAYPQGPRRRTEYPTAMDTPTGEHARRDPSDPPSRVNARPEGSRPSEGASESRSGSPPHHSAGSVRDGGHRWGDRTSGMADTTSGACPPRSRPRGPRRTPPRGRRSSSKRRHTGEWVGSGRVTLRHVSPIPPLDPYVRLSPHTAHERGILWDMSISPAPRSIHRGQLYAFAGYLCTVSLPSP